MSTNNVPGLLKLAYSINEFCELTSHGRDSAYKAIRDGKLIARKFGKRTVILDEDARAYLQALPRMHGE